MDRDYARSADKLNPGKRHLLCAVDAIGECAKRDTEVERRSSGNAIAGAKMRDNRYGSERQSSASAAAIE
jgi:hypothetical protein